MDQTELLAERFEGHRAFLRAVAYRMLGSLAEADDAVQDAWLRDSWAGAGERRGRRARHGEWETRDRDRVHRRRGQNRRDRRNRRRRARPHGGSGCRSRRADLLWRRISNRERAGRQMFLVAHERVEHLAHAPLQQVILIRIVLVNRRAMHHRSFTDVLDGNRGEGSLGKQPGNPRLSGTGVTRDEDVAPKHRQRNRATRGAVAEDGLPSSHPRGRNLS